MKIDRTIAPEAKSINKVDLLHPESRTLDNGVPFFQLIAGSQPVLRIEFIFDAGIRRQSKSLVASFANSMLTEGTSKRSAKEIADAFDYYGAFIQPEIDNDRASLTLHCLTKTFPKVFDLVMEILEDAAYPEKELQMNLNNARQKFIVNSDKVEFVARKKFLETVFGAKHPYGMQAELEDFSTLSHHDLIDFNRSFYSADQLTIVAAGNFGEEIFKLINGRIGQWSRNTSTTHHFPSFAVPPAENVFIPKEKAIQTGIRIGKQMVNKLHPDYAGLQVLNTALGGYFGSRLMANIREDKGYTYGIGSALASFENGAYFFIATEVGADVAGDAVKEIYKEIQLLRQEKIEAEELHMVKNYMLGSFLRNSDGPFAMADRFKGIYFYGLDYGYYEHHLEKINRINSEELLELANKYLDPESLTEVLAGKK